MAKGHKYLLAHLLNSLMGRVHSIELPANPLVRSSQHLRARRISQTFGIILDANGTIVAKHDGPISAEQLQSYLAEVLPR